MLFFLNLSFDLIHLFIVTVVLLVVYLKSFEEDISLLVSVTSFQIDSKCDIQCMNSVI